MTVKRRLPWNEQIQCARCTMLLLGDGPVIFEHRGEHWAFHRSFAARPLIHRPDAKPLTAEQLAELGAG